MEPSMNDLDLMETFRAETPPAGSEALRDARAAMFRPAVAPSGNRPRWVWRLAPATALAAAVAAGVAVVATRPAELPSGPTTAAGGPAAALDGPQVFRLAAAEARRDQPLAARPDQFVYVRSLVAWAGGAEDANGGPARYIPPVEKDRRIWLSVDGSRTGVLHEKAAKPGTKVDLNDNLPIDAGWPGYVKNLPTGTAPMRKWLYQGASSDKPGKSPDTQAFVKVGDTLREQYVPPAAVAAMFDAAATIPGTSVVKQVDLAGRKGIAVSRTAADTRSDLIFDATSYRFLGEREVSIRNNPPIPDGSVIGWTAQMRVAIVDRPGQEP
jgi:hypothetical protein